MPELKLNQRFQDLLREYIKTLQSLYQANLVSVILYGSAARGEFFENYSNLNVLIVLQNADIEIIKSSQETLDKVKFRRIHPLYLTEDYIRSSLDIFPIEFLDMKENYALLWGKDILKDIQVDSRNLRYQCEQELKGKLISLKHQYFAIQNDKSALKHLLFRSFTSVMHILKNLLRIKGITPVPVDSMEILRQVALEFQMRIDIWKGLLELKNNPDQLTNREIDELFIKFVKELERISNIVDKI